MDLSQAIVPKSDQLNADDLMGGPRTFTIADVTPGNDEQPVNVQLADSRPFRPSKSMLRVMVAAWGLDGKEWKGHRLTLYRDPHVRWAGVEVGGIRISHMTGLNGPLKLALTVNSRERAIYVVKPLTDAAPAAPPGPDQITPAQLKALQAVLSNLSMDRDSALAFYASTTGREVESSKALTKDEASKVIEGLKALEGGAES